MDTGTRIRDRISERPPRGGLSFCVQKIKVRLMSVGRAAGGLVLNRSCLHVAAVAATPSWGFFVAALIDFVAAKP